jgi:hypothetical protein
LTIIIATADFKQLKQRTFLTVRELLMDILTKLRYEHVRNDERRPVHRTCSA